MADTAIEWADRVWNPTTGCDRVSPGCDHCYALTMAKRLKGMGSAKYQRDGDPRTSGPGFAATYHSGEIGLPLKWRKPERIFVNSMSDLFHDDIPDVFIARVWEVMARCPQHTFMILTKRHARMRSLLSHISFESRVSEFLISQGHAPAVFPLPNVWLGVSAENQQWADIRIPALLDTPAAIRFVSAEPLIGPIDLVQSINQEPLAAYHFKPGGIDWVIVGGESGHHARPIHPQWVRSLRDQCQVADVSFFFKQWGEWAPAPWKLEREPGEFTLDYKARSEALGATHSFTGGLYQNAAGDWVENFRELSHKPWSCERAPGDPAPSQGMRRVGKHRAGRELDGRTWDQYPQAVNHA